MSGAPEEREIKARLDDGELDDVRARVLALGAVALGEGPVLEDDVLLDGPAHGLAARGCALRIRRESPSDRSQAGRARLTWKGPKRVEAGAKVREEIETGVADADALEAALARVGLLPAFRYQKERESFGLRGAVVALDRTPLGGFVEVEGPAAAIDAIARDLGLDPARFEPRSYPELWRAERGEGDMLLDAGGHAER